MKTFTRVLIYLSILFINPIQAQTADISSQLCKTWIAYGEIRHEPMMRRTDTLDSKEIPADTLIIQSNHEIIRHCQKAIYYETWKISSDSTTVELTYKNCDYCYYSRQNERLILKNLTDTTLEMQFGWGKEGECTQRMFRPRK